MNVVQQPLNLIFDLNAKIPMPPPPRRGAPPGPPQMPTPDQWKAFAVAMAGMMVISFVIQWLYESLMTSSKYQATLGKMAVKIMVTDENGKRLSFGRATGRYFAKMLSGIICYIGFIMAFFDEKKQALHDKIVKTYVVKKPRM
jgi:uncharacterized RDD family membrane protein YckC